MRCGRDFMILVALPAGGVSADLKSGELSQKIKTHIHMDALGCAAYRGRRSVSNRKKKGFIHKGFLVIVTAFLFSAGNYLFSINQNAVHGYRIRTLEKEIAALEKEQSELQSSEAEMRSLDRTKEAGARMGMERTTDVVSVERLGTVALR